MEKNIIMGKLYLKENIKKLMVKLKNKIKYMKFLLVNNFLYIIIYILKENLK